MKILTSFLAIFLGMIISLLGAIVIVYIIIFFMWYIAKLLWILVATFYLLPYTFIKYGRDVTKENIKDIYIDTEVDIEFKNMLWKIYPKVLIR